MCARFSWNICLAITVAALLVGSHSAVAGSVNGHALTPGDAPLPGVEVKVYDVDDNGLATPSGLQMNTDANGYFHFDDLGDHHRVLLRFKLNGKKTVFIPDPPAGLLPTGGALYISGNAAIPIDVMLYDTTP